MVRVQLPFLLGMSGISVRDMSRIACGRHDGAKTEPERQHDAVKPTRVIPSEENQTWTGKSPSELPDRPRTDFSHSAGMTYMNFINFSLASSITCAVI
jgi:hypothetical protein